MESNDKKVKELLAKIEEKKQKLGEKPKMILKTNGIFKSNTGETVNINTIRKIDDCVKYAAQIIRVSYCTSEAIKMLDLSEDDLNENIKHEAENYIEDFKLKAKILKWVREDNKIKLLESQLKSLRSESLKTADELEQIECLLK